MGKIKPLLFFWSPTLPWVEGAARVTVWGWGCREDAQQSLSDWKELLAESCSTPRGEIAQRPEACGMGWGLLCIKDSDELLMKKKRRRKEAAECLLCSSPSFINAVAFAIRDCRAGRPQTADRGKLQGFWWSSPTSPKDESQRTTAAVRGV